MVNLPPIGLGTAGIGGLYRPVSEGVAQGLLEFAYDRKIRYFDTAPFYGHGLAERRLGQFLCNAADDIIVSTKVGRVLESEGPRFDYSGEGIRRSLDESILRLGRLPDIVLIHDIGLMTHDPVAQARHMHDLRDSGYQVLEAARRSGISAVGIGVNETEICKSMIAEIPLDVILLAGRYTVLDQSGADVVADATARGIKMVLGGLLNSGILASGPVEGAMFNYAPASADILRQVRVLDRIAQDHHVSLRRMALQFPRAEGAAVTALLGATTSAELDELMNDLSFPVPEALWSAVKNLSNLQG